VKTSQEDFQNKKTPISSPISISTHLEKNKTTRKIITFDEEKFAEKMFQRVDSHFVPEVVFLIPHTPPSKKSLYQPYLYTSKKSSFHRKNRKKMSKSYFSRRLEDQRRNIHKNP